MTKSHLMWNSTYSHQTGNTDISLNYQAVFSYHFHLLIQREGSAAHKTSMFISNQDELCNSVSVFVLCAIKGLCTLHKQVMKLIFDNTIVIVSMMERYNVLVWLPERTILHNWQVFYSMFVSLLHAN